MIDPKSLSRIYGQMLTGLAVQAEVNEYEASERRDELGSDEFWGDVEKRLEDYLASSR